MNKKAPKKNGIGLADFILACIALFTDWIPIFGWIVWALGAFPLSQNCLKQPRGFAIAGFIISFTGLIIDIYLG